MTYIVTRQLQWPEGTPVVEISQGGINYVNPDALVGKYPYEFEEIESPMKAIEAGIAVCRAWRKDGVKEARVAIGFTHGMTMSFEPSTFKQILALGKRLEAQHRDRAENNDVEESD